MRTASAADVEIPVIGFGTWQLKGDLCRERVEDALRLGYRHLDTAVLYDNEREVGEGLRSSGVQREEVWVTTKVWRDALHADDLRRSVEGSLERLGLEQVDLLLIHWPNREIPLSQTIPALCRAKKDGLTRSIGVSNFNVALLEQAIDIADEPIVTNQVEYHPFLDQQTLLRACRRNGVSLTAYSPLAHGKVAEDPTITAMAAEKGVTPGQLTLRWLIQQDGVIAIPKTASRERAGENLNVFSFQLTADEMQAISLLAKPDGRQIESEWVDWD